MGRLRGGGSARAWLVEVLWRTGGGLWGEMSPWPIEEHVPRVSRYGGEGDTGESPRREKARRREESGEKNQNDESEEGERNQEDEERKRVERAKRVRKATRVKTMWRLTKHPRCYSEIRVRFSVTVLVEPTRHRTHIVWYAWYLIP